MSPHYTLRLKVRHYEVDRFGFVHNFVFQHYMQEAAIQASAAAGFSEQWYEEHGTIWVIRELTVEYLQPARAGDELEIHTWVADMRRVRSQREYETFRLPDMTLLVRASADWVYIERASGRPIRIPLEAQAIFGQGDRYAVPPLRPVPPLPQERPARPFVSSRRVQRHEIDAMGHVNNAVYVTWFEDALAEVLNGFLAGLPDCRLCYRRHQMEYRSPILPGEEVEIVTRLAGLGRTRAAWRQEVRRPGSEQPAVSDDSVLVLVDAEGRTRPWAAEVVKKVSTITGR